MRTQPPLNPWTADDQRGNGDQYDHFEEDEVLCQMHYNNDNKSLSIGASAGNEWLAPRGKRPKIGLV